MTADVGAALPQYAVGAKIGSGGMGVVFEGVHRSLGRAVAIKQLVPGDPDVNARFDREARVLASLDHPHIVPVYDYVQTGRDNLLVMEKLDGGTVHSRFHGPGLTGEQSCAIALAMLAGLHAAHQAGVLHLDVKPKNLLFTSAGVMKVADFGIAQVVSEGATLVTHGGEVLGTPAYIAPEQAMGNALTPAADIYAAGTVLYELLCGDLPYDRTRGAVSMMRQRIFSDPRPLPAVPAPLSTVVMRGLAREPMDRYRDAEAFAVDIAGAATAVFGPGWLDRAGVPVHLAPRVLGAVAQRSGPDLPTVATPPVRGSGHEQTRTFDPDVLRRDGLRPASELIRAAPPAPSPLWPGLVAAVAAVLMAVLPFLAPATAAHPSVVDGLTVAGQPVPGTVTVDFSEPVPLGGGPREFTVDAAGIPLGSVDVTTGEPNALLRWLVGGAVTGELTRGGQTQAFTIRTDNHPLASAMGAGSVLLGLFAVAYVESLSRALRRGYRRPAAPVAALPLGALLGAAVWMLVCTLTAKEPTLAHGVAGAAAGAVAAAALVLATAWSARRR